MLSSVDDTTVNPLFLELSTYSIAPGSTILLEVTGDYSYRRYYADEEMAVLGLFSASNTLLVSSELNRVPDAIDAGNDIVTYNTYYDGLATDIGEDFSIYHENDPDFQTVIQVPDMATHLFVGILDSLYSDNTDSDGDLYLRISSVSAVPLPPALYLLGSGLVGLIGVRREKK